MQRTSQEQLRLLVERLENLHQTRETVQEDIKEVLAEAKSQGFNTKVLRKVLQLRKMKPNEALEQEELVHVYLEALRGGSLAPSENLSPH